MSEDIQIAELFKIYQGYDDNVERITDILINESTIKEFGKLKAKCRFCWHYSESGCSGFYCLNGDRSVPVNPDDSCINFRNDFMRKFVDRADEIFDEKLHEKSEAER